MAVRPSPGSGLLQLDVPAGTYTVELRLTRTPIRLVAELISLAAVVVVFWFILRDFLRIANRGRTIRWALLAGSGLVPPLRMVTPVTGPEVESA